MTKINPNPTIKVVLEFCPQCRKRGIIIPNQLNKRHCNKCDIDYGISDQNGNKKIYDSI